jgi:hypothetical protein
MENCHSIMEHHHSIVYPDGKMHTQAIEVLAYVGKPIGIGVVENIPSHGGLSNEWRVHVRGRTYIYCIRMKIYFLHVCHELWPLRIETLV